MPNADLPYEVETIEPVRDISGATLYNRVSQRQAVPDGVVNEKGEKLLWGLKPLVIEMDGYDVTRTVERTDGIARHLIRKTLPPVTEAPTGYYIVQQPKPTPTTSRVTFERNAQGQLVGAEATNSAAKTRTALVRDKGGNLVALENEPVSDEADAEKDTQTRWGTKRRAGFGL